ncbi:MAG: tetratricopeptide repeat protein [Lachnospiraceae bacterium]|nr:tetratricopeptide repeat protein [Lachnospiraceae bacterium]
MSKKVLCKAAGIVVIAALALNMGACTKKDHKEQDAFRQYGITCLESGDYEAAVESFQKALDQSLGKVGKKELDICFYKARAQYLNGDTEDALETYNAIIKYNKDARAYYLRGKLYFDLGDQEKALADYQEAAERAEDDYELYIGIYESMCSQGMEADGQKYLNQALDRKGDKPKDCLYKGRISYLLGDNKGAVDYLTKAKEGKEELASYYLGLVYEAEGDKEKYQACIQEYIDSGVATSYELYDLGMNEMEKSHYKQAITYFEAGLALEEVPNKQNLMKSTIAAYEYRGDFDSAKKVMKEYLSLYPSDEDAKRESIFLETR